MGLSPGSRLLHYEITGKLGEGGMGEVYAARDGKLGRDVALKLLSPELANDPERVARFAREARTLASLQHPCVASIYGFEEEGERRFLVMELVRGQDLSERIGRGPVPVDEARAIALRIAEGLEAAHRKHIVHRDLKPANVKLGLDDEVKILDFGLARAVLDSPAGPDDPAASPTLTHAFTRPGIILGTAAYMSPEQARGKSVDERADVWAFGVILFEMLTGKRLFGGETISDTLAAVIRQEPDWDALPAGTPPGMLRVLQRCLAKDPRQRLQAIGDARLELEQTDEEPVVTAAASAAATATARSAWRPHPAWLLPLLIGALVGLWFERRSRAPLPASGRLPTHSSIQLPEGWRVGGWGAPLVALSPDGRTVAYVADRGEAKRLFVQRLEEPEPVEVPDSDGAEGPFFSPDGKHVAFGAGRISGRSTAPRRLLRYAIERGKTDVVCDVGDYFGGVWREDDTIFYLDILPGPLWRVSAGGGSPEPVGGPQQLEASRGRVPFVWPQLLPGGTHALGIVGRGEAAGRLSTIDLESGEVQDLGADGRFARWTGGGELISSLPDGRVFVTSFDPRMRKLGDDRRQILEGVSVDGHFAAVLNVSAAGDLIFARGRLQGTGRAPTRFAWLGEDGAFEPVEVFEADEFTGLALSPDGRRIAATAGFDGVLVFDLERGSRLPLPAGEVHRPRKPLWTPDGREIAFSGSPLSGSTGNNLFLVAADGVTPPRQLESRSGEFFGHSFVPGTRRLLHAGYFSGAGFDTGLFEIDLDGGEPQRFLEFGSRYIDSPALSPNGRWLVYASGEAGRLELYLQSFPDLSRKIPLGEGRNPQWAPRGDKLYFERGTVRRRGSVWIRDVSLAGSEPTLSAPRLISDSPEIAGWTVDPRGRGLLVLQRLKDLEVVDHFELVQNWR